MFLTLDVLSPQVRGGIPAHAAEAVRLVPTVPWHGHASDHHVGRIPAQHDGLLLQQPAGLRQRRPPQQPLLAPAGDPSPPAVPNFRLLSHGITGLVPVSWPRF